MSEFTGGEWKEAREYTKIQRISWKKILGVPFSKFILLNKTENPEELIAYLLNECKKPENKNFLSGLNFREITKNIKIGLGARLSEGKMYSQEELK